MGYCTCQQARGQRQGRHESSEGGRLSSEISLSQPTLPFRITDRIPPLTSPCIPIRSSIHLVIVYESDPAIYVLGRPRYGRSGQTVLTEMPLQKSQAGQGQIYMDTWTLGHLDGQVDERVRIERLPSAQLRSRLRITGRAYNVGHLCDECLHTARLFARSMSGSESKSTRDTTLDKTNTAQVFSHPRSETG